MDPKERKKKSAERRLRRLLRTLGKDEPEVHERAKPRVAILIPSYREPNPLMRETLGEMMNASRPYVDFYVPPRTSSSVIHFARNMLVSMLLQSEEHFDYVLFIDDDIVVRPDSLLKLLSHKRDIIAGICTRRNDPPMPNIKHLSKDLRFDTIVKWETKTPLMQVDAVGTGFMLISRKAIEAVAEYYLRCGYERQTFGRMVNNSIKNAASPALVAECFEEELDVWEAGRRDYYRKTRNAMWFQFLPSLTQDGEYGEDISFCLKARFAGIDTFVDTTVCPGHVGDYVYSVLDFFQYQDEVLKRANAQG